jgi:hypothetical protein
VTGIRTRQLRALAPALVRAVRWQPVPAAGLCSGAVLWWQDDRTAAAGDAIWLLRVVALLLAVALAFALDDRTRATLAAVPTPQWWRGGVRLLVAGLPAALVWGGVLAWVQHRSGGAVPGGALTLEMAALAVLSVAVAGGLARWRDQPEPGLLVGPILLGAGLLIPQLPRQVALAVLPGPDWAAAHLRWSVLLAVMAVVLAASWRDPAARVPIRRGGAVRVRC